MKRRFAVSCQVPSVTANLDGNGSALVELHDSPAAMAPKKGPSPKDIAAALEIEKKCLYLMSRETATELANLKEEAARYERLIKLYQEQIDALGPATEHPSPTTNENISEALSQVSSILQTTSPF